MKNRSHSGLRGKKTPVSRFLELLPAKRDKPPGHFPSLPAAFFSAVLLPALSILLFPHSLPAQNRELPRLEDFAGSLVLGGTRGGLLKLEIPEAVYQGLMRPDRGDIRVFDGEGSPVPFVIRPVPGLAFTPPPEELPFFPWEQENDEVLPGGTDIVINSEGTVLNINNRGVPSGSRAYLLDFSGLSVPPALLAVSLGKEGEFYNTAVRIYSSADLSRWREFEKPQTLAWFGGGGANREFLELPRGNSRYLLLKFDKPDLPLRKAAALFEEREIPPPPREKTITGEWQGESRRAIDYFTGGFYPLRTINFPLSQPDSIEVLVKNKFTKEAEWSFVVRTNLFRINTGTGAEALQNGPLEIGVSAPYWELEAAGDPAFSTPPACTIQWEPYELVFLGRGEGPWTLAWGNGDWGPRDSGDLKLSEFAGGAGAPKIENARPLGEPQYRAGAAKPRSEKDWGQFILWAVLILATLFLSGLAFSAAKSMKNETGP